MRPALKANNSKQPILIVDKVGVIGEAIARHFSKESLVVLLSNGLLSKENSNVLHIPFKKSIPQAPDNEYSMIFIIDDGSSVTRESAFSFIDKALENNAPLFFVGSIRNVDIEHADDIVESYENAKVLVFGDLFDKQIVFDKESSINQFIHSAQKGKKIIVLGDGLSLNFPITFSDTLKLIIKATELEIEQKIILLFSSHPTTDISLANIFKKLNPDIKIDFIKNRRKQKMYVPVGAMHALDRYDLESKVKELNINGGVGQTRIIKQNTKKRSITSIVFLLALATFILILPGLTTYIALLVGESQLKSAYSSFTSGDLQKALSFANHSKKFFRLADRTYTLFDKELQIIRVEDLSKRAEGRASQGKNLSLATLSILESVEIAQKIYSGASNVPRDDFSRAVVSFKSGMSLIEKAKASEESGQTNTFDYLNIFSNLLSNSPETLLSFFGFDVEKKYLLLFLDDKKVLPAGGWVEKVGLLKLKDGKVTSFKDYSSAEFNKSSEKTPLFQQRRYTGQKDITMANSTSNISFVLDSEISSDIFSENTGIDVDGVIGVSSDFYEKVKNNSFLLLLQNLGMGIETKNILVTSSKSNTQNLFSANNWSGGISDVRDSTKDTIGDTFGVVESNLGRSNGSISRTASKRVSVNSNGIITSRITFAIKNGGDEDFKDYVQFILPAKSSVASIMIDGDDQEILPAVIEPIVYEAKNFKPPKGLEVNETEEFNKLLAGFLVSVPAGSLSTITFSYTLPNLIPKSQDSIKYSLNVYKQPGVVPYDLNLDISLSSDYQLAGMKNQIGLSLDKDKSISATILRK